LQLSSFLIKAAAVARSGKFAFFALTVELKEGKNLAARDKTGNEI
jgi:hypothetical protein